MSSSGLSGIILSVYYPASLKQKINMHKKECLQAYKKNIQGSVTEIELQLKQNL